MVSIDPRQYEVPGQTDLKAAKDLIHKALQVNQYIDLGFKKAVITYLEVCV